MALKFIIQAVKSRQEYVNNMLQHVPDAIVHWDRTGDNILGSIHALRRAGPNPVVMMEDDLILCRNFRTRITSAILTKPNAIIKFFFWRNPGETQEFTQPFWCIWDGSQCYYLPSGYARMLSDFMKNNPKKAGPQRDKDTLVSKFCYEHKPELIHWKASLAQHIVGPSAESTKRYDRRTRYFIDQDVEDTNRFTNAILMERTNRESMIKSGKPLQSASGAIENGTWPPYNLYRDFYGD